MDSNGKSDPYVSLKIGKAVKHTKSIRKTLAPTWKERFEFNVMNPTKESKLQVSVYDKDIIGADDLMGRAEVNLLSLDLMHTYETWQKIEVIEKKVLKSNLLS